LLGNGSVGPARGPATSWARGRRSGAQLGVPDFAQSDTPVQIPHSVWS